MGSMHTQSCLPRAAGLLACWVIAAYVSRLGARGLHSTADVAGALPHKLCEVTGELAAAWHVKLVLVDLTVPAINCIGEAGVSPARSSYSFVTVCGVCCYGWTAAIEVMPY